MNFDTDKIGKFAKYIYNEFDGASAHCTCKWCGYKGMVDSQGNLF